MHRVYSIKLVSADLYKQHIDYATEITRTFSMVQTVYLHCLNVTAQLRNVYTYINKMESLLAAAGDVHNLQQQCAHNVHKT